MNCVALACASHGCQATIHVHHDVEKRMRESGETFYCPAGHSNYFPRKTKTEVTELKRKLDQMTDLKDRFRDLWEEAVDARADMKLALKQCPFDCGWRVVRKSKPENIRWAIAEHLVEAHGAEFPPYETLTEAAEGSGLTSGNVA